MESPQCEAQPAWRKSHIKETNDHAFQTPKKGAKRQHRRGEARVTGDFTSSASAIVHFSVSEVQSSLPPCIRPKGEVVTSFRMRSHTDVLDFNSDFRFSGFPASRLFAKDSAHESNSETNGGGRFIPPQGAAFATFRLLPPRSAQIGQKFPISAKIGSGLVSAVSFQLFSDRSAASGINYPPITPCSLLTLKTVKKTGEGAGDAQKKGRRGNRRR